MQMYADAIHALHTAEISVEQIISLRICAAMIFFRAPLL